MPGNLFSPVVSPEKIRFGVDGYQATLNAEERSTCHGKWCEDYQYLMTPTRKALEWNQTIWIDDYNTDRREEHGCYKVIDVVFCKLPICLLATGNCLVVAGPGATIGCLFRPVRRCCSGSMEEEKEILPPQRMLML